MGCLIAFLLIVMVAIVIMSGMMGGGCTFHWLCAVH